MAKKVDINKLLEIKEQIEKARQDFERATGKKQQLEEQLQEKYNVSTVEEAETLLSTLEQEVEDLNSQIEDLAEKLRTDYNFDI